MGKPIMPVWVCYKNIQNSNLEVRHIDQISILVLGVDSDYRGPATFEIISVALNLTLFGI